MLLLWHDHDTVFVLLQLDGGITFTEPTAIIAGQVEGRSDVSDSLAHASLSQQQTLVRVVLLLEGCGDQLLSTRVVVMLLKIEGLYVAGRV